MSAIGPTIFEIYETIVTITSILNSPLRDVRALGRVSINIDETEKLNISTEMLMNEKLPKHV